LAQLFGNVPEVKFVHVCLLVVAAFG